MRQINRVRVLTDVGTRSRTKQSFKDDTDVNAIMRKYLSSGLVSHMNRQQPRYGDFSSGVDFKEALDSVRDAEARFLELPSHVRDYVDNDPAKLLDLVFDPARVEEVRKLGLIPPGEETPKGTAVSPSSGGEDPPTA